MTTKSNYRFDYIVIGAGSAGCVLANRLSEEKGTTVLLLEYGGADRSPFIKMPAALSIPMHIARYNWGYYSEPETHLNCRRMSCPRGKVLGGTSSINGMVYVRGHARDFDEWEMRGAAGWSYQNCLPYFRKSENCAYGANEFRGVEGPLHTCNGSGMANPLYSAFINAGHEAGYPKVDDYNGREQEGFGRMDMTVWRGKRWSAADAYLKPASVRPNLTVSTGALCHRIVLKGQRAVAVDFDVGGLEQYAQANREIILCAGAIGSPQLLQLSGIGPADVLAAANIPLRHALPGVGRNLQDHLEVYLQFECRQPITLNRWLNFTGKFLIGARWYFLRSGLGCTNHFESCGFIRSRAGLEWPDIQYHFLPGAMSYDGRTAYDGHGFQVHVGPNKPKARGSVNIISSNPQTKPKIRFDYMDNDEDRETFRKCISLTREIIGQPAMDPYRGREIQPGLQVHSDDEIDSWLRANAVSAYHPSCTCKMGADNDDMAVLDANCRVKGIEGLRVVDSSIFPTITNGNLNAPTIMVAERAADLILGRSLLPPSEVEVYVESEWHTRQRLGEPVRPIT